jgi:23S rRNA pseudouridine955/2504/2580 synthase
MKNPASPTELGVRQVAIDDRHAGQRLDNFLIRELKGVPKSRIYRILRKGEVRVNGGRAKPDYRLEIGDRVRLPPIRMAPAPSRSPGESFRWLEERVLYEDEDLLVIDKPAGMAVHGGTGVGSGLIEALRSVRPEGTVLELVHRLDRGTSGCLLMAKSRTALNSLHRQMREGGIDKRYLALVRGRWRGRGRSVRTVLEKGRLQSGERMVRVAEEGQEAESHFTPRQSYAHETLVEIRLMTGRTHQARVHAAHLGHPIAGDDKYGDREFNRELRARGLRRLFLHAARLGFVHPASGCKMQAESPLPSDLQTVLDRLHEAA